MAINIALNTPVISDGILTVVAKSADSQQYSFTAQGGTSRERKELAVSFFEILGYEDWMVEMVGSTYRGEVASTFYIGRRNWK